MTTVGRPAAFVLLPIALACVPGTAPAQELGVFLTQGRSDLREIETTDGFGVSARILTIAPVTLHVSGYQHGARTDRVGRVCNNYTGSFSCNEEAISTRTLLRGIIVTANLRRRILPILEVDGGAGLSMNTVNGSERTASGRPSNLFAYSTGQYGVILLGGARIRPLPGLPVTLNADFGNHRVVLRACAAEDERYSPYCGTTDVREIRFGIMYDGDWHRRRAMPVHR